MRKILIVGPAWVGDMIMSQGLLKILKLRNPDADIDVLAPPWTRPLLAFMPEVRRAIEMPFRHGELNLRGRRTLGRSLRPEAYDVAYVIPRTLKAALIAYWAGIPKRVGHPRGRSFGILTDHRAADPENSPHQTARFAALADDTGQPPEAFPPPALSVGPDQVTAALEALSLSPPEGPLMIIAPGSGNAPAKRWPAEHFAEIARHRRTQGWAVWIDGSPADAPITAEVADLSGGSCLDLKGRASIAQSVALISLATEVVTNDSGALHIAAALGKRTVAVFGPTDPAFALPKSPGVEAVRTGIECSPCYADECPLGHFKCMRDLTPAMVLAALDRCQ
ncbi:MAG: lipopolysaccharide heptosyltransferase II [Alphaproteobacteria bacterium]|nr:lipopolysaccharide heptosyltransferase II [Alphaproteobacteria bacterium]